MVRRARGESVQGLRGVGVGVPVLGVSVLHGGSVDDVSSPGGRETAPSGSIPSSAGMGDPLPPDAPTPRWVKVAGIIGMVALVLIVLALLTGRHNGPTRHQSPAPAAGVLMRA